MSLELEDKTAKELIQSGKPVMIDFFAKWCNPCKVIAPVIKDLHDEFKGIVAVGKIDIDEHSELAEEYKVRNIPTVLFFNNGKLVDKQVGSATKHLYKTKIAEIIK